MFVGYLLLGIWLVLLASYSVLFVLLIVLLDLLVGRICYTIVMIWWVAGCLVYLV